MDKDPVEPSMLRIVAELPADAARELADLAKAKGLTLSEAIRRSIMTEAYLQRERDAGGKYSSMKEAN
jgi:hypothetical protein